jgi:hypothetical protein
MTNLTKFEQLLREHCRTWSEICAGPQGVRVEGVRIVYFSGPLLRDLITSESTSIMLGQLFEQLPLDAAIIDVDGQLLRMRASMSGAPYDEWGLLLASKEWDPLKDGEIIPILKPVFMQVWTCAGCGYTGNKIDRSVCEVCTRGRGD